MSCTYADDDFLVQHFPFVVVLFRAKWRVTVNTAGAGDYTTTLNGLGYTHTWQAGEDTTDVRDGMQAALAPQLLATTAPFGPASLDITEVTKGGVESFSAAGPNDGDVTTTVIVPQDNATFRQLWLDATECWVNCCYIRECNQALYHAALAAHMMIVFGHTDESGQFSGDYESMRLGPAMMNKGVTAVQPGDDDLKTTGPGRLVLRLRRMYVPTFLCA